MEEGACFFSQNIIIDDSYVSNASLENSLTSMTKSLAEFQNIINQESKFFCDQDYEAYSLKGDVRSKKT